MNEQGPVLAVDHAIAFDLLRHAESKSPELAAAVTKARVAGIPWSQILMVILAQIPNILAGNWAAVIAAIVALIVPHP